MCVRGEVMECDTSLRVGVWHNDLRLSDVLLHGCLVAPVIVAVGEDLVDMGHDAFRSDRRKRATRRGLALEDKLRRE